MNMSSGDILLMEFMQPNDISATQLSKLLHVSTATIYRVIYEKRPITVKLAMKLGKFFGNTPNFWLNLQQEWDVQKCNRTMTRDLARIKSIDELRLSRTVILL